MTSLKSAMRIASGAVSIHRQSSTSYTIITPYDSASIGGPSASGNACSYRSALVYAGRAKADVALAHLGYSEGARSDFDEGFYQDHSTGWRDAVLSYIRRNPNRAA
jgi:hypothetical protein